MRCSASLQFKVTQRNLCPGYSLPESPVSNPSPLTGHSNHNGYISLTPWRMLTCPFSRLLPLASIADRRLISSAADKPNRRWFGHWRSLLSVVAAGCCCCCRFLNGGVYRRQGGTDGTGSQAAEPINQQQRPLGSGTRGHLLEKNILKSKRGLKFTNHFAQGCSFRNC